LKSFEYGDMEIGSKEMAVAIASKVIGVGILSLPRTVGEATQSSDGWISILLSGLIALGAAWLLALLPARFPRLSYYEYAALLVSKPVAQLFTWLFIFYCLGFVAYEIRAIADISKQYIFNQTPVEVIALMFLLIIQYAVSGKRIGIIRLNMLFFPLSMVVTGLAIVLNFDNFELNNLKPMFVTDWRGIGKGMFETIFSLLGFDTVLIYAALMQRPEQASKAVVAGMIFPVVLYPLIYLYCIAVFSHEGVTQIIYPTIELAKEITIPGQFFERFESLFFIIWNMAIFNTGCLAMDGAASFLQSMYRGVRKITWLCILGPLIYLVAMLGQNIVENAFMGTINALMGIAGAILIPLLLLVIASLRGVRTNETNH